MVQLLLFSLSLVIFQGCIATSNEIAGLKEDITNLKSEIAILKKNQAELNTKMDSLNRNLTIYTEKLEESKHKMSLLAQKMDDVQSSLSQRMDILSKQLPKVDISLVPLPTELFQISYNDYSRGLYDLSIRGFKNYLEKYPDSELAPKAYYYLADSYFAKNQFSECIKIIDEYLTKYSKDELIPTMLFRKAQCLVKISHQKQAEEIYQYILQHYPNSKEAEIINTER